MERREFLMAARIRTEVLKAWIEVGWLVPGRDRTDSTFSEVDVARAQLIRDLYRAYYADEGVLGFDPSGRP
jgi:hypothetical protein